MKLKLKLIPTESELWRKIQFKPALGSGLAKPQGHQWKSFQGANLPKPGHKIKWYWVITQRIKYLWVSAATNEWLNKLIKKREEINLPCKRTTDTLRGSTLSEVDLNGSMLKVQVILSNVDPNIGVVDSRFTIDTQQELPQTGNFSSHDRCPHDRTWSRCSGPSPKLRIPV